MASSAARYHALDGLRAVMMLLGLVIHAAVSYMTLPAADAWPFRGDSTSAFFDYVVFYIHVFRMPIFYVIAGFFAALLYLRRGAGGLARNRIYRVAVPFVLGWVVLLPLVRSGFEFANVAQQSNLAAGWSAAVNQISSLAYLEDSTMHLWFLYYLLMFYAFVLLVGPLLRLLPEVFRRAAKSAFGAALESPFRALLFAIPTALTIWPMPEGNLQTSTSFVPDLNTFAAYAVFFVFGWLLYERRDELHTFQQYAWTQVILATLLIPLNTEAVLRASLSEGADTAAHATATISGAVMVWLLVFGVTGLFLRHFDRPSPAVRYVVDSSYWLYLFHLPFTIWLPGLMTDVSWPAGAQFLVILIVMTPILLLSYDLLVRPTAIGALLNGRRYPRGLPKLDDDGVPHASTQSPAATDGAAAN
jgi:peptidoglycan/LPS O-acetylase OafA/YrhL